jgi:DNA-binding MarR family transcriptional regulator
MALTFTAVAVGAAMDDVTFIPLNNIRTLLQLVSDRLDGRLLTYRQGTRYEGVRQSDAKVFFRSLSEPRTMAELARNLHVSRQAVQMSVKRLMKLGVVELRHENGNKRDKVVVVTERGKHAEKTAIEQITRLESECAAIVGMDGLAKIRQLLAGLAAGLPEDVMVSETELE